MMQNIGILGGGISGLFLALFLNAHEGGNGVEVLEANSEPGGLARCFGRDGFRSDIGGHILFSKDKEALSHEVKALGDNVCERKRENRVLYNGMHVKYPFENGIDALSAEERAEILYSYVNNPHAITGVKPENFSEWMLNVFGEKLVEKYLGPYNEKIWKTPLTEMSLEWVDRVPRPPLVDMIRTACGVRTEGYTHQSVFSYPKAGGFEALPKAVAKTIGSSLKTNFRTSKILGKSGSWRVIGSHGEERHYEQLVSTIPIDSLLRQLPNTPPSVMEALSGLRFNSLRVVLIGVNANEVLPSYTALYVPNKDSLAHRLCFNRVFADDSCPPCTSSVSCEITCTPGSPLDMLSDEDLLTRVEADLIRDGIIKCGDNICHRQVHRERLAYVVYTLGYAERMRRIRAYTDSLGIHLAGRFAEYQYINTDACVRRALDLSKQLST